MRKCPKCQKWSFDYDNYFGRYRCFDSECLWMPPTSTEGEMLVINSDTAQSMTASTESVTITAVYDKTNDIILFRFGTHRPSVDLPSPDGRIVWQVNTQSAAVVGFVVVGAKEFGISNIRITVERKKQVIEEKLKTIHVSSGSRPFGRRQIEQVISNDDSIPVVQNYSTSGPFDQIFARFQEVFTSSDAPQVPVFAN